MARNQIQDIVPNGRTIRNIPLSERRIAGRRVEEAPIEPISRPDPVSLPLENSDKEKLRSVRHEFEKHAEHNYPPSKIKTGRGMGKFVGIFFILAAVIAGAFVVSNVFHGATLTVTPRIEAQILNDDLSNIPVQNISVEQIGSREVKTNGEKQVTTQASGVIVIYNNYSAATQRLVKNTRFETPEGLIYRISDSVTVPGKVGSTPGSFEATVYADEAGEKYNVGLKDFTIPGFKGDPRHTTFYARSKTPLEGGFNGKVKIVAEADLVKAQTDIKTEAVAALLKQVKGQASSTLVLFDKAHSTKCTILPQESVSESLALIKMRCTLTAAFLEKDALSSHIAGLHIQGYKDEPIVINNIETLAFTPKIGFDPAAKTASFNISGNATFEWLYDEAKLKEVLAGKTKGEVASVLKEFPMIEKADISIRPVWRRVFPEGTSDITIKKAE